MQRWVAAAVCCCALAYGAKVWAEAKEQTVVHTITIDAAPEVVWEVAGDFVGLNRWYPMIESSTLVLGKNREIGCIRKLRRLNGTWIEEKLLDYDPWNYRLEYTYAEGMPLSSDYFSTLQIKPAGPGKSLVEWKARFKRLAYWTDDPPPGQDDETVIKALNNGYKRGLENLKKVVESSKP